MGLCIKVWVLFLILFRMGLFETVQGWGGEPNRSPEPKICYK